MNTDDPIRLATSAELRLIPESSDQVVGFAVLERWPLPCGLLETAIAAESEATVLVFVSGQADSQEWAVVQGLVERVMLGDVAAAIRSVPAIDAVKRVEAGTVAESIDRSTLNVLRLPEVVSRMALQSALADCGADEVINPAVLISRAGGRIGVVGR